jgi:putative copper export protein
MIQVEIQDIQKNMQQLQFLHALLNSVWVGAVYMIFEVVPEEIISEIYVWSK